MVIAKNISCDKIQVVNASPLTREAQAIGVLP